MFKLKKKSQKKKPKIHHKKLQQKIISFFNSQRKITAESKRKEKIKQKTKLYNFKSM